MKDIYVKILADHTADVIKRTSGLTPGRVLINECPEKLPQCELAVRIEFGGQLPDKQSIRGYLSCGTVRLEEFRPLLSAMARHFGLEEALLDNPEALRDLLSEFLNIVIGLTGADWSAHGFVMDFGPPTDLSGRPLPPLKATDKAYHLTVNVPVESGPETRVDLLAVFSD